MAKNTEKRSGLWRVKAPFSLAYPHRVKRATTGRHSMWPSKEKWRGGVGYVVDFDLPHETEWCEGQMHKFEEVPAGEQAAASAHKSRFAQQMLMEIGVAERPKKAPTPADVRKATDAAASEKPTNTPAKSTIRPRGGAKQSDAGLEAE